VGLQQPARLFVLVRRGGRVVRKLRSTCIPRGRRATVRWDGRLRRRGKLRPARPGRYRAGDRALRPAAGEALGRGAGAAQPSLSRLVEPGAKG